MFDFGEILVIGVVALIVLGPERLPQAARTIGAWVGKLQGYVSQVRVDIDREFNLADLRRISEEARASARSVETAVRGTLQRVEDDVAATSSEVMAKFDVNAWSSGGPPAPALSFPRRYRPRPSIDDLNLEIERLKRQLAVPAGAPVAGRRKYAPRARINRARVRR
jgi:sec-independent protein translocase protein TatB